VPEVREMYTDAEVASTYSVMRQLRPHLDEGEYPGMVRRMRGGSYRLAAVLDGGWVGAAAGFKVVEFLMWGRLLYVDDLVTAEGARSKGHGKRMLDWLAQRAHEEGCGSLQLDSGVQRGDAHRFYFRGGMRISSYHFSKEI